MIGKKQQALVLDIGCNDGTLLSFYPPSYDRYGIDPSDISRGVDGSITIINDLFPSVELKEKLDGRQAEIVTSIAMFYDWKTRLNSAVACGNSWRRMDYGSSRCHTCRRCSK